MSSFITVTINSRDRYEIIGLRKISYYKLNNLVEELAWKKHQKCIKVAETMQYLWAKQSRTSNILIHSKLLKFEASPKFRLMNC